MTDERTLDESAPDDLPTMARTDDERWMHRALDLASRGQGRVEPNPMVGCVVVRGGVEISHGWHERFGGPHAEANALAGLSDQMLRDADVFVSLEPCSHHGKTPPCADLLLRMRPRRVIVAMLDPFPAVAGSGVSRLRAAGIDVEVGVLESEARALNRPYLKRWERGLPWVIAKWAMTLDGAIATSSGDSKWITGTAARQRVHALRSRMDAILVGSETVLRDDPLLTARPTNPPEIPRRCTRVVIDRRLRIPIHSQLVRTAKEHPLLVVSRGRSLRENAEKHQRLVSAGVELLALPEDEGSGELDWILRQLCARGATNVLVEGGGELLGSLFDQGCVDELACFIAPKILGSRNARRPASGAERPWMNQAIDLEHMRVEGCDNDVLIRALVTRKVDAATPGPS